MKIVPGIKQYFRARTNHDLPKSVGMIFIAKETLGKIGQAVQEQKR